MFIFVPRQIRLIKSIFSFAICYLLKSMFQRLQTRQNNKSSAVKSKSVSPPDMSPIHTTENNELHEKIARCSRSAIRLDFAMDMSIDNVVVDKSENSINGYYLFFYFSILKFYKSELL